MRPRCSSNRHDLHPGKFFRFLRFRCCLTGLHWNIGSIDASGPRTVYQVPKLWSSRWLITKLWSSATVITKHKSLHLSVLPHNNVGNMRLWAPLPALTHWSWTDRSKGRWAPSWTTSKCEWVPSRIDNGFLGVAHCALQLNQLILDRFHGFRKSACLYHTI